MKEKCNKRKSALKKARDLIVRKKALRKDMCDFLVKFWMSNEQHPLKDWEEMMRQGFRGYEVMRAREVVKRFDNLYYQLRTRNNIGFWKDCTAPSYSSRPRYGERDPLPEEEGNKVRQELLIESDALMSRLLELAFNLDVEE